jgi:hypothetical protein
MKTYTFDTSTPCLLFTFTRVDGTVERITDASVDVTVDAVTWAAHPGLKAGVKTSRHDGTPPTMGFQAQLGSSSPLKFRDVDRGKYERADVLIESTSFETPTSKVFEFNGEIRGNVEYDPTGLAQFDLISRFAIPRDLSVRTFTLPCAWEFGDPRYCKVPLFPYIWGGDLADVAVSTAYVLGDRRRVRFAGADNPSDYLNVYLEVTTAGTSAGSAPSYSSTVGATTSDGSVVWTTRNAWARNAQVTAADGRSITFGSLPDPRASDSTWYHPAKIMFATGEYKNRVFKGSAWDSATFTIETYLPCPFVAVGDWVEIAPDCDKTFALCKGKFSNAANHGGFPLQAGAKAQAQQLGYAP